MLDDIQVCRSDHAHQCLIEPDLNLGNNVYVCMFLGKDYGRNIMKSIKEGHFSMGTVSDVINGGSGGLLFNQGPEGSELTKDDRGISYLRWNLINSIKSKEKPFKEESCGCKMSVWKIQCDIIKETISEKQCKMELVLAGNVGGQNRGDIIDPGQAKTHQRATTVTDLGIIAREMSKAMRLQIQTTSRTDAINACRSDGAVLYENSRCFLQEKGYNVDDNVDESPGNDLASLWDHVFEADE
ncbi:hypothetical protein Tco_0374488 [Tanacetum coccineum]